MDSRYVVFSTLTLLLFGSGCFDPFEGCGKVVLPGWTEPGLYDAFPAPGGVGDFFIRWSDGATLPGEPTLRPYKEAHDKNLTDDLGVTTKWIRVEDNNWTGWSLGSYRALSQEDTGTLFEKTFRELGLPSPTYGPTEFHWRTAAC